MLDLQEELQDVDKHLQASRLPHMVAHKAASLAEKKRKVSNYPHRVPCKMAMIYMIEGKNQKK